jgi:hypothetical protein
MQTLCATGITTESVGARVAACPSASASASAAGRGEAHDDAPVPSLVGPLPEPASKEADSRPLRLVSCASPRLTQTTLPIGLDAGQRWPLRPRSHSLRPHTGWLRHLTRRSRHAPSPEPPKLRARLLHYNTAVSAPGQLPPQICTACDAAGQGWFLRFAEAVDSLRCVSFPFFA